MTDQRQINFPPHARARTTDPDTSHQAAKNALANNEFRNQVLAIHKHHPKGMTDEELCNALTFCGIEYSESKPRKYRGQLAKYGFIAETELRRESKYGSAMTVWRAV